jgi:multiple sugar transport system substrate-binding protein
MVVTSFGTGESPDVARIDIVNTASYAKQSGLAALSDLEGFDAGQFLEGPLSTNLYQGKYYGMPLDTNCKAAVINTNILKDELGVAKTDFTMEELIAAAESRGQYSINVSGVGDWDLYPYFWLFGGVLTDDGFTKAAGSLDGAQSVKAVDTLIDLHDKKIFTIRDSEGSIDAWDGIHSDYAMFLEGPWFFGAYEEKADLGIIASTVPTYNGKSASVVGGENIVVFSTSKQQEAAYKFAQFMTSEQVQLLMLKSGQLPILKSLVEHTDVTSNPVWSVYMRQLSTGAQARIPSPYHSEIGQIWSDAMNNIFVDGKDVQAALTDAAARIDELLNK